jgi:hypothetical protein
MQDGPSNIFLKNQHYPKQIEDDKVKIITISAKAMHGKDLSAQILKTKLEENGNKVLIYRYADYLKFLCRQYFDWDGNKDEKGRTILQYVGTNIVRNQQPDFWVETAMRFFNLFGNNYNYIIICDCRFVNEIELLRENGYDVLSLHIKRLNFQNNLTEEQRNHPSETSLDNYQFDRYLYVKEGINNLEKIIYELIENEQL